MDADDNGYFFIRSSDSEGLPIATPDTNTEDRKFGYLPQPVGSPPLVFHNGARDYDQKMGARSMRVPAGVLFCGADLIVNSDIRMALLQLDVPHLHMHSSVYIHDDGKWYEDYWFLTFSEDFDCWDRERSDYKHRPIELGGFRLYSVYTYRLNRALLDRTPLEQRRLFKMGGSQDGFIVCHESVAGIFRTNSATGVILQPVSEY